MNNFTKSLSVLLMLASSLSSMAQEAQTSENEIISNYVKNMVKVKGGTFMMGATDGFGYEDERPVHSVSLSSFMISKYEVTQQLWQAVMNDNPSSVKGDNLPVNNISWDECQTFIAKLNEMSGQTYRLATDAEWEFAARGGTAGKDLGENNGYQFAGGYQNTTSMDLYMWNSDNSDNTIHPVGTKEPNELGLYDMNGNVCEYVQDYYTSSYSAEAQQDPKGADSGTYRVYRGGSYERPTWQCRLSCRFGAMPNVKSTECGLRLTMDVVTCNAKMMVVTTMDGKQTKLGLKNEPNVTIEEPYLVYKSNVAEARFELDQLRDIKYEDVKPIPGDASGDGVINKADVDETILYILGTPSDDFNFNNADVNNDQVVNIADVIHIINTINNLEKNERLQSRNTADSQQHQYAIYNYRNDNDFNAFLNVDIDKITYSKIGIDSTVYNNVVVQEVWTPYQIYRIPIEAIDSLGFHTPETKYNEKVFFLTDNHIPYIKNVDDLTITFASSIPKDMLPVMGQIIVAETSEDPLEDGFAGRITNIVNNGDGKVFICEEVALGDIFDRLLFISKCATNSGLDEDLSNNVRRSRTRATIDIDQVIHIDLDPIEINPDDESENKEKFPITMKYQPDMSITCFVNVVKNCPAIAKITFSHSHSFYFQAKYEAEKEFSKEWWFGKKDIRIHIPVKAVDAVIKPYIRFGAFIDANCKAKFEYTVPLFKFEHTFGLDYNEAREEDNRVQFINDAEITHETPTMKLSVDGSLAFGLAIKLGAKLVHEKLLSFESTFHVGPKLFGHFDLYSERLAEDANLYRQLKTTTLQLNGYVAMTKATYRYFGSGVKLAKRGSWKGATWSDDKAIKKASWLPNDLFPDGIEYTWYINKWYLLPHFDPPRMTELTESSALASLHPYHSVIFPVHIGLALKKYTTGDVIEYDYGRYWGESDYDETKFEHIFEGLEPSTTYKVYPTVSLFGLKMDAEPSTDYGVSDKLLINPNKITISKGETAEIVVTGGTGRYSSIDGNSKIAHGLSFNYDVGPKTGEKAILTIVGVNVGESIITILDTDNVSSCILTVNVIDSETPTLSVSSNSLNMYERTTCSVEITSGSGKYAAESSNTDVATVIVNDGKIQVTAIKAGTTTITVTDTETTQIATIEVTVTIKDISSIDLPAGAVDLGLSVKWASCNIGASKPEDFGEYYSWGEILPKEEYLFDTYKWAGSNQYGETISERYTKYNEIDGEIMIGMEDDAAFANTLGKFRMPTSDEFQELLTLCSYEFVTRNGVAGFLISANNGNRIFLPLAGSKYNTNINYVGRRGCYWASDLRPYIYTDPGTYVFQESAPYESTWNRYMGLSIRAVQDTQTPVASMELSNNACNFGKIPIGGKCFSDVFIKNTGKVNLKLNIPTPSLPFSMELARVNSIGSSMMVQPTTFDRVELLEGESLRIRIWFTPTELTKSEFLISVKTNSSDNDEIIFLKGEGTQTDSPDTPIDLGLSVNWSNHNIGATSPEKEGDLFAWGEIETKEEYTGENYKWYKGSTNWITKYYNGETYFFGGKDRTYGDIDNKTQLEASDDVARYVLGSHWKIPTKYECEELFSKCSKYWGFLNGVEGCFFKGSTDKTIFISVGSVWTSTISEGSRSGTTIQILNDEYNPYTVRNRWKNRESGLPVRPVNSVE